jgi:hypothetical protein
MAISAGKSTGGSDGTFAALTSRLARGKGKIWKGAAEARSHKTAWNKTGKKTFAAKK